MGHPNEQKVRAGYEAFHTGDVQKAMVDFTDDIVWHVPGKSPQSGDYKGKEEVLGFWAGAVEWTEGSLRFDVHDIVADDEHAVALVTATAKHEGKPWNSRQVHVWHTTPEGKVTEFWSHPWDEYADDEFWSN